MRTAEELRKELRGMDRRSYPAYKSLAGTYQFEKYKLIIDHVQGDPFASPSSLREYRRGIMRAIVGKLH